MCVKFFNTRSGSQVLEHRSYYELQNLLHLTRIFNTYDLPKKLYKSNSYKYQLQDINVADKQSKINVRKSMRGLIIDSVTIDGLKTMCFT